MATHTVYEAPTGVMGGSGLMDNDLTFLYLGGFLAVVGVALVAYGAIMKKAQVPAAMTSS